MEHIDCDFCVVGAGFAGLAAAYKLNEKGSVCVLEARNRVGGRVYTEVLPSGVPVNWGGTFIGDGHHRIYALAKELGCQTYPSYTKGDKILILDGKAHRFSNAIPRINPLALVDLGIAVGLLNSMALQVPLHAPWEAAKAQHWDSITLGAWIENPMHTLTESAKKMLKGIWTEVFMSDPIEVSLLHALFVIHSLKNIEWIISDKHGAQQDLLVGGMQGLCEKMASKLKNPVKFNAPVYKIVQNKESVDLYAPEMKVKARRVIMAIPPILASHIDYEPLLPPLISQLLDRSPAGQAIRCYAIYDEPFWREQGLTGVAADADDIPQATIDASPAEGKPGVLTAYIWGPPARHMASETKEERKKIFLKGLTRRFGPKAQHPIDFAELDWSVERYTRGDMFAHYGPGILTGFGKALREPCGRIHFAGTETATQWAGSMEGAVLSGERAATEILNQELVHK